MKKIIYYFLALLSGLIISSPWITSFVHGIVAVVAFIPLLYAENEITKGKHPYLHAFLIGFICFFTINFCTISWLKKLLSYWGIGFLFYNTLIYSIVFLFFAIIKRRLGKKWGYLSLIIFFTTLGYLFFNIPISFPYFTFGEIPATSISLIQWYEYTGILGGTFWVLACNISLYILINQYIQKKSIKHSIKRWTVALCIVFVPILFSLYIYHSYEETNRPQEIVIVQPNFDPYKEKFVFSFDSQLDTLLMLSKEKITYNTDYLIFPETAIDSNLWLNNIDENYIVHKIKDSLLTTYPKVNVITGIEMMEYYITFNNQKPTLSARKVTDTIYFDFFNAAIQISSGQNVQAYKKSKLVPGTEYIPLSHKYPQLENWFKFMGGSLESRGTQPHPSLFSTKKTKVAPIICFESLFGEYVSQFVQLGAEFICIITNDGWWNGSLGPLHHFRFAQIRAIENRRSVVRCGNTGISAYINQKGEVIDKSAWWTRTSMRNTINKNDKITFYTKHGDYIGRLSSLMSSLIILVFFYNVFQKKKNSLTGKKK